ncbi:SURF1 family protein [Corallincola platygyrae]|uniref:SURF1-like protein n=1 Tax=Corallincola platygyrae TaxID=1193278 RepID=A0ABW4XQT7_9GAMM
MTSYQFDLPGGSYQLNFTWTVALPALAVLSLLVALGTWQLGRADEKKQLLARAALAPDESVLSYASLPSEPRALQPLLGTQLALIGSWQAEQVILLDNRMWNKRVGYQVLVPLRLHDSNQLVLVNLGWVAAPLSRDQLPDLSQQLPQALAAISTIQGRLRSLDSQVMVLAEQTLQNQWPLRVQSLDPQLLSPLLVSKEQAGDLVNGVLLLDESVEGGFPRQWPVTTVSVEKHQAYAFQWFTMALVFACIMLSVGLRRTKEHKTREHYEQ